MYRLALGLVFLLNAHLSAADWPRFRGPNGTGIVTDTGVPIEWDNSNYRWKKEIPGIGNSSPIVAKGKVFLQASSNDQSQRFLYCIDAKTGSIDWSYTGPGGKTKTHAKNSPASSTPATDGNAIYCIFWDGNELTLTACDFTGKELWKRPLGSFKSRHGAGLSPIVENGKVIIALDQDGQSVLSAFDTKSGDTLWTTPRKAAEDCSYSTPFRYLPQGKDAEIVVASTTGMAAYREKDGKEVWHWNWKFPGQPLRMVGSPILAQGLVIGTTGNGGGSRAAAAVKIDALGEVATPAWEKKKSVPYVPTLISHGDHLYGVNDVGQAVCIETKTGEDVFVERLAGSFTASPIMVNGNIIAVNEEGMVFVFAAKPSFELLAKNNLNERVYASPAVADGTLFIRGGKYLYAIAAKK